jgi:hypothetical protein
LYFQGILIYYIIDCREQGKRLEAFGTQGKFRRFDL